MIHERISFKLPSPRFCRLPFILQHILNTYIDKTKSECLNEADDHPFTDVLVAGPEVLQSDCDEQLILFLTFSQSVKLHSLLFKAAQGKTGMELCCFSVGEVGWAFVTSAPFCAVHLLFVVICPQPSNCCLHLSPIPPLLFSLHSDEAPKTVRIFLNQIGTPSFDDVERMKAVQEFE